MFKNMEAEYKKNDKVEPIFTANVNKVLIAATLDLRYQAELRPIVIRVTKLGKVLRMPTGVKYGENDKISYVNYEKIRTAKGSSGNFSKAKNEIKAYFDRVVVKCEELCASETFSFAALRSSVYDTPTESAKTLQDYWRAIAESKDKHKTKEMYYSAMRSLYKYLGCKIEYKAPHSSEFTIKGNCSNMAPKELTEKVIDGWVSSLVDEGKSQATIAVYLRAVRAVLYKLRDEEKVIKVAPKMGIKSGTRRKDDFLKVPQIISIREFGKYDDSTLNSLAEINGVEIADTNKKRQESLSIMDCRTAADWWVILYLCNGCNMKDLAQMEWGNDYFNNNELSFVRSKTEGKAPVKVYVPIGTELRYYLNKYASKPELGQRVFPQILNGGQTDTQITNAAHRYNMLIRKGMSVVCEILGIQQDKPITASTARNSYITTLTWHQVSDAFIDGMVGHADGSKVLRGYQGTISPKMRAKYNALLFVDPEEENVAEDPQVHK